MFKPFLLLTAIVSLGIAVPPTTKAPQKASAPAQPATSFAQLAPDAQAKVKGLYKIDCALCHGDDGNGQTDVGKSMELVLDNWTDAKVLAGKNDQVLFDTIRKGKEKMPAEPSARATDTEVRNLILYIRSLAKEHPDAAPASTPAAETTPAAPATPPATPPATEPSSPNQ